MEEQSQRDGQKSGYAHSLKEEFGHVPLCNHRADRGIFIHGFCLPLCARCTGLLVGAIAGTIILMASGIEIPIPAAIALIAPTAIDGFIEYGFGIESTNRRRLVTGLMAGFGCAAAERFIVLAVKALWASLQD